MFSLFKKYCVALTVYQPNYRVLTSHLQSVRTILNVKRRNLTRRICFFYDKDLIKTTNM